MLSHYWRHSLHRYAWDCPQSRSEEHPIRHLSGLPSWNGDGEKFRRSSAVHLVRTKVHPAIFIYFKPLQSMRNTMLVMYPQPQNSKPRSRRHLRWDGPISARAFTGSIATWLDFEWWLFEPTSWNMPMASCRLQDGLRIVYFVSIWESLGTYWCFGKPFHFGGIFLCNKKIPPKWNSVTLGEVSSTNPCKIRGASVSSIYKMIKTAPFFKNIYQPFFDFSLPKYLIQPLYGHTYLLYSNIMLIE
jgi:hypothetical protein